MSFSIVIHTLDMVANVCSAMGIWVYLACGLGSRWPIRLDSWTLSRAYSNRVNYAPACQFHGNATEDCKPGGASVEPVIEIIVAYTGIP